MELLERRSHAPRVQIPSTPGTGGDGDADREAAQRFLRAADDAVAGALSGDSLAFLNASRQQSGE